MLTLGLAGEIPLCNLVLAEDFHGVDLPVCALLDHVDLSEAPAPDDLDDVEVVLRDLLVLIANALCPLQVQTLLHQVNIIQRGLPHTREGIGVRDLAQVEELVGRFRTVLDQGGHHSRLHLGLACYLYKLHNDIDYLVLSRQVLLCPRCHNKALAGFPLLLL